MSVHELNLLRAELLDAITENRGRLNLIETKLDAVVSDLHKLATNLVKAPEPEAPAATQAPIAAPLQVHENIAGNGTGPSESASEASQPAQGG
jgi:hypothetical protein